MGPPLPPHLHLPASGSSLAVAARQAHGSSGPPGVAVAARQAHGSSALPAGSPTPPPGYAVPTPPTTTSMAPAALGQRQPPPNRLTTNRLSTNQLPTAQPTAQPPADLVALGHLLDDVLMLLEQPRGLDKAWGVAGFRIALGHLHSHRTRAINHGYHAATAYALGPPYPHPSTLTQPPYPPPAMRAFPQSPQLLQPSLMQPPSARTLLQPAATAVPYPPSGLLGSRAVGGGGGWQPGPKAVAAMAASGGPAVVHRKPAQIIRGLVDDMLDLLEQLQPLPPPQQAVAWTTRSFRAACRRLPGKPMSAAAARQQQAAALAWQLPAAGLLGVGAVAGSPAPLANLCLALGELSEEETRAVLGAWLDATASPQAQQQMERVCARMRREAEAAVAGGGSSGSGGPGQAVEAVGAGGSAVSEGPVVPPGGGYVLAVAGQVIRMGEAAGSSVLAGGSSGLAGGSSSLAGGSSGLAADLAWLLVRQRHQLQRLAADERERGAGWLGAQRTPTLWPVGGASRWGGGRCGGQGAGGQGGGAIWTEVVREG